MTVSPSVLLLSIAIGVPLMLLALGVLYHAHLLANQQQPTDLDAHVEQLAVHPDEVLESLQRSMEQVRGDLTRQRAALRQMMSESARRPLTADMPVAAPVAPYLPPQPAPQMVSGAPIMPMEPPPAPTHHELSLGRTSSELRSAVSELAAEGLSDRAIARRLRIGLEEVRLARSTNQPRRI